MKTERRESRDSVGQRTGLYARRAAGLVLIAVSSVLTLANMPGPPRETYTQEIVAGEDVIELNDSWDSGSGCVPAFDLVRSAVNVSLFASSGDRLALMWCDDGAPCIRRVSSFAACIANTVFGDIREDASTDDQIGPAVSCDNSLPILEMPRGGTVSMQSDPNIKECNDEFTVKVEYADGSSAEAKYFQYYRHEQQGDYTCEYPR